MTCVHTGCGLYVAEYNVFAYGDAHAYPVVATEDGENDHSFVYAFRISHWEHAVPEWMTRVNYTIFTMMEWWDRDNKVVANSTLLADGHKVMLHGYRDEGMGIGEFKAWYKSTGHTLRT